MNNVSMNTANYASSRALSLLSLWLYCARSHFVGVQIGLATNDGYIRDHDFAKEAFETVKQIARDIGVRVYPENLYCSNCSKWMAPWGVGVRSWKFANPHIPNQPTCPLNSNGFNKSVAERCRVNATNGRRAEMNSIVLDLPRGESNPLASTLLHQTRPCRLDHPAHVDGLRCNDIVTEPRDLNFHKGFARPTHMLKLRV